MLAVYANPYPFTGGDAEGWGGRSRDSKGEPGSHLHAVFRRSWVLPATDHIPGEVMGIGPRLVSSRQE